MHIIRQFSLSAFLIGLQFSVVRIVEAQTAIRVKFDNPLRTGDTLYDFIQLIINEVVIPIGGVVSVLYIIYAGFMFVTAQGNPAKIEIAKKALLYGAIGAGVILGAWAIANAIEGTINQLTN